MSKGNLKKKTDVLPPVEMLPKHYRLTKEERETHYCISEFDNTCTVYTSIPKDIRAFKKKGWPLIKESYYPDGDLESCVFKSPRKFASSPRMYYDVLTKPKNNKLGNADALTKFRESQKTT